MPTLYAVIAAALLLFLAKTLAWIIQRRMGNGGIVDALWAWALGSLAVWFAAVGSAPVDVRLTLAFMGGLWGLRLGIYLWRRNWRSAEDWRYAKFRAEWGDQAQNKMFWFFQFQNVFTLALACSAFLPAAYGEGSPGAIGLGLALAILLTSVWGEGLADAQMRRFKADPASRGAVCDVGLWRYSRHPNYFFECVHWLAYIPLAWGGTMWGWTLIAPLVMVALLLKISGVPLLEAEMAKRKPGYADYMKRTSMLLPWPPKRASTAKTLA